MYNPERLVFELKTVTGWDLMPGEWGKEALMGTCIDCGAAS